MKRGTLWVLIIVMVLAIFVATSTSAKENPPNVQTKSQVLNPGHGQSQDSFTSTGAYAAAMPNEVKSGAIPYRDQVSVDLKKQAIILVTEGKLELKKAENKKATDKKTLLAEYDGGGWATMNHNRS